jgi:kumamolisin
MAKKRIPIPGSERTPLPGAQAIGPTDPNEFARVTVRLRPRKSAAGVLREALSESKKLPAHRKYLTREQLAERSGADPKDLQRVYEFARNHNLTVVDTDVAARTVRLTGAVADLNAAFGVALKNYEVDGRRYRGREGKLSLPAQVAGVVEAVHGLDNRPVAKPHYRVRETGGASFGAEAAPPGGESEPASAPRASDGSFSVPQLAKLYGFPPGLDGRGQCIALIELNDIDSSGNPTGTGFALSDLNKYFSSIGLATPNVVSIGVDGGANVPGKDPGADGEVALDIEVAGALAPGAQIAVYFAPNTTAGFIDAVNAALSDEVRKPSVISISWGLSEDLAPKQFLTGMSQAFADAAALGVTICCAAGDNGSADMDMQSWDRKAHVDFPASIPYALGCGGTKLIGSGSKISSEVVWNEGVNGGATGGGVSNQFARPSYQSKAKVPKSPKGKIGRGVPDVAGDADPQTGYQVIVGGQSYVYGGTSAVAPLWAGLLALINQRLASKGGKPVGFLNTILYSSLGSAFNDITSGNNDINGKLRGLYQAGKGWDPCTGLGTPNGVKLLKALGG